jgi:DNA-binding winged helix-turn-helix (wHTH) protein
MSSIAQYEKLLAEMNAGELSQVERKVLEVLLKAPGGITRRGLIQAIYGVEAQRNLSNDPHDRKIRKAIERMRECLIPIVASSGKAGYRLDTSPEVIQNMIMEMESRIAHLKQRLEEVRQIYDLPGENER